MDNELRFRQQVREAPPPSPVFKLLRVQTAFTPGPGGPAAAVGEPRLPRSRDRQGAGASSSQVITDHGRTITAPVPVGRWPLLLPRPESGARLTPSQYL